MEEALVANPNLVRNGKKVLKIKSQIQIEKFDRQILCERNNKKVSVIPINKFFGEIHSGKAFVSRNLERKAIEESLLGSYRKSEQSIDKKLSKETIRRTVIQNKEQAEKLDKTATNQKLTEQQLKDTDSSQTNYKQSKGNIFRKLFGYIFERKVLYFMADGVGVEQQDKTKQGERLGKRECKVATFLKQTNGNIEQIATFCTWKRITQFRTMLEWTLLKFFSSTVEIIIISDGAKWIRNTRNNIPALKKAKWILDWFHLKDRTLKILLKFEIAETSKLAQTIIGLCWHGMTTEAFKILKKLPLSNNEEKAEQQKQALQKYETYLKNQKEGIINYQAYKMKGYLIGSGCVEKINDQLVKDRMVRQGRMRWGIEGGEAMMQLLTAKWNGRLSELFA